MATNFPGALDTAVELGGTWNNAFPVTDPITQIDAQYRTNIKDAMFAVQARIGATNSLVPSSLAWATLSAGGVDNLGLRFQQAEAQWPGATGESGIFMDSASMEPMFHRGGEPVGTFYPLIGGGGSTTWDAIYAIDKTFTLNADPWAITQTAGATGIAIALVRDAAFAGSASLARIANENTTDGEAALELANLAGGEALLATSGTFGLAHTLPGSTAPSDTQYHLVLTTTGGALTHSGAISGGQLVSITSGGMDGVSSESTIGQIVSVTGDATDGSGGSGADLVGSLVSFLGKNGGTATATGVRIGSGWDEALKIDSGTIDAEYTTPAVSGATSATYVHNLATVTSGGLAPDPGDSAFLFGKKIDFAGDATDNAQSVFVGHAVNHDGVGSPGTVVGYLVGDGGFGSSVVDIAMQANAADGIFIYAVRNDTAPIDTAMGHFRHTNSSADVQGTLKNVWSRIEVNTNSTGTFYGFYAESANNLLNASASAAYYVSSGGSWQHAFRSENGKVSITETLPASAAIDDVQAHLHSITTGGNLTHADSVSLSAFLSITSGVMGASPSASTTAALALEVIGDVGDDAASRLVGVDIIQLVKNGGSATATGLAIDLDWDFSIDAKSGKARLSTGSATFGDSVLELQQLDDDEPFFTVFGKSAIDQSDNISTANGDAGVTGPQSKGAQPYGWEYEGMIRVNVQGTDYWMPYYSESP